MSEALVRPTGRGIRPKGRGIRPTGRGIRPTGRGGASGLQAEALGLQAEALGLQTEALGLQSEALGLQSEALGRKACMQPRGIFFPFKHVPCEWGQGQYEERVHKRCLHTRFCFCKTQVTKKTRKKKRRVLMSSWGSHS